jgi:hypothetical protein
LIGKSNAWIRYSNAQRSLPKSRIVPLAVLVSTVHIPGTDLLDLDQGTDIEPI